MRITLRLPLALHEALEALAREQLRSLNAEIVFLLTQAVQGEPVSVE